MFDKATLDSIQNDAGINPPATDLAGMITAALPYLFGIAGIILLLNIISSGLKMMTSRGDPKALQGAQAKLSTSAIGILVLFLSFWIIQLIMQFLGVNTELFK